MITTHNIPVEQIHVFYTCDVCGDKTAFREPLVQHYVNRHLTHMNTPAALADLQITDLILVNTAEEYALLEEAKGKFRKLRQARWDGPGWYAIAARDVVVGWEGNEEEETRVTILHIDKLALSLESQAARALGYAKTLRTMGCIR